MLKKCNREGCHVLYDTMYQSREYHNMNKPAKDYLYKVIRLAKLSGDRDQVQKLQQELDRVEGLNCEDKILNREYQLIDEDENDQR